MPKPLHSMSLSEEPSELEELRALLAAKEEELRRAELLMREVNHRVANSLQLASSILRMQAHQETDPHTREQLEKAGLRIGSIQHVHARLYRSGDMQTIELSQYLRDLCNELSESVMQEGEDNHHTITTECERMRLPTDFVSKLGLVINEFVTNAFKHAETEEDSAQIRVHVRTHDDHLILEVSDNGPGLDEDFDMSRIRGLGMKLVRSVASSLGGDAGARNGETIGAVFWLRLPLPAKTED